MTTIREIYEAVDVAAPFAMAMDRDNVGILVGSPDRAVHRVMLCLDITPEIVAEAAGKQVDLIVSHHPVIFQPMTSLFGESVPYLLAAAGIGALCCHTNLDFSDSIGVNIALGKVIGLSQVEPAGNGLFMGKLPAALDPLAFAKQVKTALHSPAVFVHPGEGSVRKVCVIGGAAGSFLAEVSESDADALVVGELKHHERLLVADFRMTVIEAGHYETEQCFTDCLMPYLQKKFPEIGWIRSKAQHPPMTVV